MCQYVLQLCLLSHLNIYLYILDLNDGIIIGVFALIAVDCVFKPKSGQTKYYKIGLCCFPAKRTALRSKSNVGPLGFESGVSDRSTHRQIVDQMG